MIITISGPARSGKNYVGELIHKHLPNSKCYAFADLLKEYVCELFGIDIETLNDYKNNGEPFTINGITMRTIIQRFGTEIFVNKVDKLYWVKKLEEKIHNDFFQSNIKYAIITDARFKHELDYFNSAYTYKIGIIADTEIKESNHISENSLVDYTFDMLINNVGQPNLDHYIKLILEDLK